jgi:glycosyltransferase involved in cell wall biosynthesis
MATRGSLIVRDRYNVGLWAWELGQFPQPWRSATKMVNEIWVSSEFERSSIEAITDKPVRKIPLAVRASPSRNYSREEFGLPPNDYLFLFTFDFKSYVARKNPEAVARAFTLAFPAGDEPVALMLKSTNGHVDPDRYRRLIAAVSTDVRIHLMDRFLSRDELNGLQSVADVYVSLHRSEGYGLGMAEAMSLGKPVVATGYSGNLEFMTPSNSFLVGFELVKVRSGEYPYGDGQAWAEPDVGEAAQHMRRLAVDRSLGIEVGRAAQAHIAERFSPEAVGRLMQAELARIIAAAPRGLDRPSVD